MLNCTSETRELSVVLALGKQMLEETKSPKFGKWLALTILIMTAGYVGIDGWLTNKIESHTAVAVYEPGGVRALVNETDKPDRMWKWPRILGTPIGMREEPVKDETRIISTKFAMYTDESIYIGGMMFRAPQILLGPDVLGFEGLTSESFQQDLVVRAKQTLAALEAQMKIIGLNYKESESD